MESVCVCVCVCVCLLLFSELACSLGAAAMPYVSGYFCNGQYSAIYVSTYWIHTPCQYLFIYSHDVEPCAWLKGTCVFVGWTVTAAGSHALNPGGRVIDPHNRVSTIWVTILPADWVSSDDWFCQDREEWAHNSNSKWLTILRTSLLVRLWAPNAKDSGSVPGQGTGSHLPQLRVLIPQLSNNKVK